MRLWHTTLKDNLPSIKRRGILTEYSRGALKVVWLHTTARQAWAFLHVVRRHGGDVRDVVSIEVEVDPSQVRRAGPADLYYHLTDVSPSQFACLVSFNEVSESPLKGRLTRG